MLALGAVHLEVSAGNDLLGPIQHGGAPFAAARAEPVKINVDRSAKGDRAATVTPAGGVTLSFRVPGSEDSSVMVRMPSGSAADARKAPASTSTVGKGSSAGSRPIACEPVVSVLTAVARQLAPGRCIT
ncbi:MAG: hypothetical protein AB7F72_00205 [Afipia sp.]